MLQSQLDLQSLKCDVFMGEIQEIPIKLSLRNLASLQLFGQMLLGQDETQMDGKH